MNKINRIYELLQKYYIKQDRVPYIRDKLINNLKSMGKIYLDDMEDVRICNLPHKTYGKVGEWLDIDNSSKQRLFVKFNGILTYKLTGIPRGKYPMIANKLRDAFDCARDKEEIHLDFTDCEGGEPEIGRLILSLVLKEGTRLENLQYLRNKFEVEVLDDVTLDSLFHPFSAPVLDGRNIVCHVSGRTSSVAEQMCYNIQKYGQGVIVGGTSAGDMTFGMMHNICDKTNLAVKIPHGYYTCFDGSYGWTGGLSAL
jgi:hypothetical protein